jgi:ADP-heptose:LPS heptosyltransferase
MEKFLVRLYKYYLTYIAAPMNRVRRLPPGAKSLFIAKFDGLGDFFLLLPVLKQLRGAGWRVTVAGNPFQREILDHCGLDIASVPFAPGSVAAVRTAFNAVREARPEYAVNLSMSAWGGILVNQSRAPHTAGLLQEREWYVYKGTKLLYDRTVSYDPSLHGFEVTNRFFSELLQVQPAEPHFERPAVEGREIAVHPYAKWPPRRWPWFEDLIGLLLEAGYRCVLLGTPGEHEGFGHSAGLAARFEKTFGCRVARLDSVSGLLAEIERCRAFIGNDSGPAHYAALIGRPTFVLWGPGNYDRVRPLGRDVHIIKKEIACRPCRQRGETCTNGINECLRMISVEVVMKKFREHLKP